MHLSPRPMQAFGILIFWIASGNLVSDHGAVVSQRVGDKPVVGDFLDARHFSGMVPLNQPFPECRAEIESVMQVLGLNEDIRVEQIMDQLITPTSRPRLSNVLVLDTPSIRKASR